MAPELLRGESSNTSDSDIYSFGTQALDGNGYTTYLEDNELTKICYCFVGIILYEVYSRRDPYEDEDPHEVLKLVADKHVKKRPPTPRHMPDIMKSLMLECVDDNPENRPSSEEVDIRLKRVDVESAKPGHGTVKASSASLFDMFPRHIAEALRDGRTPEPDHRESVTIFFSDIVGFTTLSATLEPRKVAQMLDRLYTRFDHLSQQHDIFKGERGDKTWLVTFE